MNTHFFRWKGQTFLRLIVDYFKIIVYHTKVPQSKETITKEGVVVKSLPGATFRVKLNDSEEEVLAHLSGRMRLHRIRVLIGDRVRMEMSPYDPTKGRIVYRDK